MHFTNEKLGHYTNPTHIPKRTICWMFVSARPWSTWPLTKTAHRQKHVLTEHTYLWPWDILAIAYWAHLVRAAYHPHTGDTYHPIQKVAPGDTHVPSPHRRWHVVTHTIQNPGYLDPLAHDVGFLTLDPKLPPAPPPAPRPPVPPKNPASAPVFWKYRLLVIHRG